MEVKIMSNDGLKSWQKALLGVIAGFITLPFILLLAIWIDDKVNPISKYWDKSSSPVQLDFMNKKTNDNLVDDASMTANTVNTSSDITKTGKVN